MALATTIMNWRMIRVIMHGCAEYCHTLRVALVFVLVLLIAAVALCVMRLGLAGTTTVLALLDGATLGVYMVQFAVCGTPVSNCVGGGLDASRRQEDIPLWLQPLTR